MAGWSLRISEWPTPGPGYYIKYLAEKWVRVVLVVSLRAQ